MRLTNSKKVKQMMLAQIVTNSVPTLNQSITGLYQVVANNKESLLMVWGAIVLVARSLRKVIPDKLQTGSLGTVLKHAALEINPATPSNPVPATPTEIQAAAPITK